MLAGPIFARELLTSARRRQTYGRRTGIAIFLTLVLGANYYGWNEYTEGKYSSSDLAWFACTAFCSLVSIQGIVTIAMVPAQVATTIAEEKERKTLHYLLSSDLSSTEIVVGKLTTGMLQYVAAISAGLPVMGLLTLLGGVDPRWVFLAYGGTLSMAYLLAGLSILMSVLARRPRAAVNATLSIAFFWLIASVILTVLPWFGLIPRRLTLLSGILGDWILPSSPLTLVLRARGLIAAGPTAIVEEVARMAALQVAGGTVFIAIAIWRLRPVFRAQEGSAGRDGTARQRRRRHRPECSDIPILWKECYPPRLGRVAWLFRTGFVLAVAGGFGYSTIKIVWPVFYAMFVDGGLNTHTPELIQTRFMEFARMSQGLLYSVYALLVLSCAASSITTERERDTWDNLLTTTVPAREIVIGKMRGAVWQQRWILGTLLFIWFCGLASKTLHPVSVLVVSIETFVFTWFVAALGVWASLFCKNTSQAAGVSAAILLLLNLLSVGIAAAFREETAFAFLTCMPFIECLSLFSYEDLRVAISTRRVSWPNAANAGILPFLASCAGGLLLYAVGAAGFSCTAIRMFDRAVGRPRKTLVAQVLGIHTEERERTVVATQP